MRRVAAVFFFSLATGLCVHAAAAQVIAAPALDHVGIQASDLDRTIRFYTTVLGLREVPAPFSKADARWMTFENGYKLHVVGHGQAATTHNKWDHIALACSDLPAMIARLESLHVAWTDMSGDRTLQRRPDGVTQIFIRDPDGYNIELNDARSP